MKIRIVNPGTARGRLGIAAAGAVMLATVLAPASAIAAQAAGPVPAAPADSSGAGIAVTGPAPGTGTDCTSHWQWQANADLGIGGYSEVEWTSNPCGFSIQERSWCDLGGGSGYWSTSGVVVRTGLWDESSCDPLISSITRGEWRFLSGSGWSTYKTFWTA